LEAQLLDAQIERKLAASLFNATWRLLDKTDRTAEDNTQMIHCAHASRFHAARVHHQAARELAESIEDQEDRNILESDLPTLKTV
jgi:hypothetical protein